MCGIVAIASRPRAAHGGSAPDLGGLADQLQAALDALHALDPRGDVVAVLDLAAGHLHAVDRALQGADAVAVLAADPVGRARLGHLDADLRDALAAREAGIDAAMDAGDVVDPVESVNVSLVAVKDALWAIGHDRLAGAAAVLDLAGADAPPSAFAAYHALQLALSALDRLEVRGRDSAGLHVLVRDHGLDLDDPTVRRMVAERIADPLFCGGAVRVVDGRLSFVYKTAAEIGELGDNTAALRAQIRHDELLRLAVRSDESGALVLGHTRWASVGIISEANAHPLNSDELAPEASGGRSETSAPEPSSYVVAALNGDVDNYADLVADEHLRISGEITTDAKVIPVSVARRRVAGAPLVEAFRGTVASFEGSVAIGAVAAEEPDVLLLAQRGSGQALYVGLADGMFVVASEPYGLVEVASHYFRLDGETMRVPGDPGTQGQVVVLDGRRAGELAGVLRIGYEGIELPLAESELLRPEMTTRDVDRGNAPHYFWKEVTEAPASFRKTLRGRIVAGADGLLDVALDDAALPAAVHERLASGDIRVVHVIGQGTAAIAGQSLAFALQRAAGARLSVDALTATELSGFGLREHMSDTLVIAISQSGTTTDTNRTVDLARARGAAVVSIVNRRQSDLVDKSDGVLYTSDGRDVEMAVASTKAFYAQIAAGTLLAYAIARAVAGNAVDPVTRDAKLAALRRMPDAMTAVIANRPMIAAAAQSHAPGRRSWTVVGNGVNRVAAQEIRIKLSELCYKSIGCDSTEDKKHIDLSSEPLIMVCAAGLVGSNADDVAKEVAIFRAHKAAPIVIATEGELRFGAAYDLLTVPAVHPELDFVLSAMVGHVFGYEAALAIDASARPLREARAAIEAITAQSPEAREPQASGDDVVLAGLAEQLTGPATRFFEGVRAGTYDSAMEAATAVRLASVLRFATGIVSLDAYQLEMGKAGTPSALVDDLVAALTRAIDELTRPVDAIKHQAKTVTVGISRSDETLLRVRLVREVLTAGAPRDALTYRALRTLVELDDAIAEVVGFTRYRIEGDIADGATIHVVDKGGVATGIPSRTDVDARLRGTKHRAAFEREVTVVRGRADGRTVIYVPELKGNQTVGITLLHARFHEYVSADVARRVLNGYRGRYAAIQDQVTETEPTFRDEVLAAVPLVSLLTEPVALLAERWRILGDRPNTRPNTHTG
jgi:glucosamine--fructose-6-phosphate aminotransferase (isomerizing)